MLSLFFIATTVAVQVAYSGQSQEYCNSTAPAGGGLIETNAREVSLHFTSDRTNEKAGFSCSYTTQRKRVITSRSL